jgi:hypothetical protein
VSSTRYGGIVLFGWLLLALVGAAVFYYVVRAAVRDGILAAWTIRESQRRQAGHDTES